MQKLFLYKCFFPCWFFSFSFPPKSFWTSKKILSGLGWSIKGRGWPQHSAKTSFIALCWPGHLSPCWLIFESTINIWSFCSNVSDARTLEHNCPHSDSAPLRTITIYQLLSVATSTKRDNITPLWLVVPLFSTHFCGPKICSHIYSNMPSIPVSAITAVKSPNPVSYF